MKKTFITISPLPVFAAGEDDDEVGWRVCLGGEGGGVLKFFICAPPMTTCDENSTSAEHESEREKYPSRAREQNCGESERVKRGGWG